MLKQALRSLSTQTTICSTRTSMRPNLLTTSTRLGQITQHIRMGSTINTVFTKNSYAPIGHYSQAFSANGQVWVAGQVAADVDGNLVKGSVTEQAHVICNNVGEILKAAGSSLEKVVKVNVFVTDFSQLPEFNAVYNTYFPQKPPRTSVEVSKLPLGVSVEVDIIAVI